jgi:malonyl-CoA O-methyltransferase
VAASFSKAATSYDDYAQLQRKVAAQLLTKIPVGAVNTSNSTVLDLGCGTGNFSEPLQQQCSGDVIGLDLAQGMLNYARKKNANISAWLCADAEALPIADQSLDGIYSSLAVQWCQQPQQLFSEIKRVLKPGAWAAIATLGPATLQELRQSWAAVDDRVHVNQFIDQTELLAAIKTAGFAGVEFECQDELMQYQELKQLTRELKNLGANNRNAGLGGGLQSRRDLLAFKECYETYRGKNGAAEKNLPASYQVYYIVLTV